VIARGAGAAFAVAAAVLVTSAPAAAAAPHPVLVVHLQGDIDGRVGDLLSGGVRQAVADGSPAIIVDVDSKGGRSDAIDAVVATMRRAPMPVLAWVGPGEHAQGNATRVLLGADLVIAADGGGISGAVAAPSPGAALRLIDGRTVVRDLTLVTLHTAGATTIDLRLDALGSFRQGLADPDAAFLLLILAIACIGLWAVHPVNLLPLLGTLLAGAGAAAGLMDLPVQWFGAGLIAVAVLLFIADLVVTSHGVITAAGVLTLIAGGGMLVDRDAYAGGVSTWLLGACAAIVVGAYAFVLPRLIAARRLPVVEPMEELVGRVGTVTEALRPEGLVRLGGTYWRARSTVPRLKRGDRVRVVEVSGLRLVVTPEAPVAGRRGERTPQTPQPIT
jgi:membrane-bound ClpP family serine protease